MVALRTTALAFVGMPQTPWTVKFRVVWKVMGPPVSRVSTMRHGVIGKKRRGPWANTGAADRMRAAQAARRNVLDIDENPPSDWGVRSLPQYNTRTWPSIQLFQLIRRSTQQRVAADLLDMQLVAAEHPEHGEAVADTPPEADLGRLGKIARPDRDLPDPEPMVHPLGDNLGVEDEIVRVALQIDRLQIAPAVGAQPRMVLRQEDIEDGVGHHGE